MLLNQNHYTQSNYIWRKKCARGEHGRGNAACSCPMICRLECSSTTTMHAPLITGRAQALLPSPLVLRCHISRARLKYYECSPGFEMYIEGHELPSETNRVPYYRLGTSISGNQTTPVRSPRCWVECRATYHNRSNQHATQRKPAATAPRNMLKLLNSIKESHFPKLNTFFYLSLFAGTAICGLFILFILPLRCLL